MTLPRLDNAVRPPRPRARPRVTPRVRPRIQREQAPEVSVVVPVLDEAGSLRQLQAELAAALANYRHEIIYVDDGSRDESPAVLRDLQLADRRVRVLRQRRTRGKTAAWAAGFARARGELIVTIDADLQDVPAEIPPLLSALAGGADLATAWRRDRRDRAIKRLSSWTFNRVTAAALGLPLHDVNCGLKAFRRECVADLPLSGDMHRFFPVLVADRGFRVVEVPAGHRPRRHGRSKYGIGRALAGPLDLLRVYYLLRWADRPLRFFGAAGLLLWLAALIFGLLALLVPAGNALGRWPELAGPLAAIAALGGLQAFGLGLLAESWGACHPAGRDRLPREADRA